MEQEQENPFTDNFLKEDKNIYEKFKLRIFAIAQVLLSCTNKVSYTLCHYARSQSRQFSNRKNEIKLNHEKINASQV